MTGEVALAVLALAGAVGAALAAWVARTAKAKMDVEIDREMQLTLERAFVAAAEYALRRFKSKPLQDQLAEARGYMDRAFPETVEHFQKQNDMFDAVATDRLLLTLDVLKGDT